MKRILIILPSDTLGGAEQFLKMVCEYHLNKNHIVCVFFLKAKESGAWENLKKHNNYFPKHTTTHRESVGLLLFVCSFFKFRKVMFDYAYTSHVHTSSVLGFLRKIQILKVNFFIARESTLIFKRFTGFKLFIFKMFYKLGYSKIDLLICQTDYMRKQLMESLTWLPGKIAIEVIGNPVSFNNDNGKVKNFKDKIEMESPYIVSAGRLINEKGFDVLISSLKNIKLKFPDYKLVILGEGELRDELQKKIIFNNLENDVKLLGFVKNVYPYFKYADLCVVSSRIEGFPNVLLQMMSQNTKIVSTKCAGGIEEIPGIFIAETNDQKSLEQAMELALKSNTTDNRGIFDVFLNERSIDSFMNKIELHLLR